MNDWTPLAADEDASDRVEEQLCLAVELFVTEKPVNPLDAVLDAMVASASTPRFAT